MKGAFWKASLRNEQPVRCNAVSPKTNPSALVGNGRGISEAVKPMRLAVARNWFSAIGDFNVGEEDELLEAEDVEPLRTLPTPELPSRSEIEKHRIDH